MTGMLASVDSLEEANLILSLDVDIIDLKQPAKGALGALSIDTVKKIVSTIAGQKPVSATIGDLPVLPGIVYPAVEEMTRTGVDFVKIGFFPGHPWVPVIDALSELSHNHALIAVLFADCLPDFSLLPTLQTNGFAGVMLDTMDKSRGSLTEIMSINRINQFVRLAKQHQLMAGLAGSLKLTDIPDLLPLHADYLGFRGALCTQNNRAAKLSPSNIDALIACIHSTLTKKTRQIAADSVVTLS